MNEFARSFDRVRWGEMFLVVCVLAFPAVSVGQTPGSTKDLETTSKAFFSDLTAGDFAKLEGYFADELSALGTFSPAAGAMKRQRFERSQVIQKMERVFAEYGNDAWKQVLGQAKPELTKTAQADGFDLFSPLQLSDDPELFKKDDVLFNLQLDFSRYDPVFFVFRRDEERNWRIVTLSGGLPAPPKPPPPLVESLRDSPMLWVLILFTVVVVPYRFFWGVAVLKSGEIGLFKGTYGVQFEWSSLLANEQPATGFPAYLAGVLLILPALATLLAVPALTIYVWQAGGRHPEMYLGIFTLPLVVFIVSQGIMVFLAPLSR